MAKEDHRVNNSELGDMMKEGEGEEKTEEGEDDISCGIGRCRPSCMQGCASIGCMTWALSMASLFTSTLNVYISSQITTLERQFGFSSSVSGTLLSCNDFGYLLTTLLMSYLARRIHIPRALSVSTFLFGVSGLLCALPFFISLPSIPPASQLLSGSGAGISGGADVISGSADVITRSGKTVFGSDGVEVDVFDSGSVGGGGSADVLFRNGNASEMMSARSGGPFEHVLCRVSVVQSSNESVLQTSVGNTTGVFGEMENGCDGGGGDRHGAMSEDYRELAVAFIALGMIFQGFGKSPRQPFMGTYIDDNVPKTKTGLYFGIVSATSVFGPVLAFTLGGVFSKTYITLEDSEMSPMDPRWVGAWWLGFLMFGSLGILAAIPTLFFPRRLQPQPQLRQLEMERKRASKGGSHMHDFKEFFKSLCRVLHSPVYVCLVLGTCSSLFGVSGLVSFMPKYLETQFLIPAWKANIILGVMNITSAVAGTLTGGLVTSRLKMTPLACLKMVLIVTAASAGLVTTGFFLGCEQPVVSMGASSGRSVDGGRWSETMCGTSCQCDDTRFFPTCGFDGVTYFSPCHAGCSRGEGMGFFSCSCVNVTLTSSAGNTSSWGQDGGPEIPEATPGFCDTDCVMLYPFALCNFVAGFLATLVIMPSFIVSVRSVSERDKPLSIGLSAFMSTLLGWFVGPIAFGKVVDTCCLLWSSGCDGDGSCSLYDLDAFRFRYHIMYLMSRVLSVLLYSLALVIAVVKKVRFAPQHDRDVILDTLPPEGEAFIGQTGGKSQRIPEMDGGDNIQLMEMQKTV